MRIGDFLLQRGWVTLDALAHVLAEQHVAKMRLCSLLVSRGLVSFDNASRALGEQLGVASVLRKHLVHRDQSLAAMLPAALARRIVAMPIGKLGDGAVIVCVRDASRANYGHIARSMPGRFVIAVAPSMYLERLVEHVYTPKPVVDVPIDIVVSGPPSGEVEVPVVVEEEPVATAPPPAVVESEPPPAMARTTSRALPVVVQRQERQRDALDGVIATLADIDEREWLFDVAMGYVTTRWESALLFELRGDRAVAIRGHGAALVEVSLTDTSLLSVVRDERRLVAERLEVTAAHAALAKALGNAIHPVAAPVANEGADELTLVLAVGQPVRMAEDPEDAAYDLGVLAETMGDALARIG